MNRTRTIDGITALALRPLALTLPAAIGVFALSFAKDARADTIESGYIVSIEEDEIYFNIPVTTGLKRGDPLRVKRPIKLRHPVTKKLINDWLPLGSARVTIMGNAMGMAVISPELLSVVQVGDRVESLILKQQTLTAPENPYPEKPAPVPVPELPPLPPLPTLDAQTQHVLDVWHSTVGTALEVRIGTWEDFLAKNPDSPYAGAIHEDLQVLRAHRDRINPPEIDLGGAFTGGLKHDPPTRGRLGEPLDLAFLIDESELAAAWIHYRIAGSSSYSKGVLTRDGDNYLRGRIPSSGIQGPSVEYFVEIATQRGNVGTAVGTPEAPVSVVVPTPALTNVFKERANRSRVTLTTEIQDYAMFDSRAVDSGERTDTFFLFEADFFYRLRETLYGVRTGLGILNGEGGFTDGQYSSANPAPKAGFNYGYAEVELRGPSKTALLTRLVAGVGRDGFGVGVEARVRLGDEDATNLSLGASSIQDIGFLTELRMQWNAVRNIPLGLSVGLTDRPHQGDLGVRLTTDIGYRALSWVQPTIRVSYVARNVAHAGLGVGFGFVFDW